MLLVEFIKPLLRKLGVEVRRYTPGSSPTAQLMAACASQSIDLVLDIGANVGQFGEALRKSGYFGEIVSFEPIEDAYRELLRRSGKYERWVVHERCAIGAECGFTSINVTESSVCSSILPSSAQLKSLVPESSVRCVENVRLETIDSVAAIYLKNARSTMIKIDAQGYEWWILEGASATLSDIKMILVEMSVIPLYDGQKLWRDIIDRLEGMGFQMWSLHPSFVHPGSGRAFQFDAIFCRA